MIALKYTITTEQPLLITSLQGDPNSSVSFDYIPGSAIRGALIGLYQQKNKALLTYLMILRLNVYFLALKPAF